MEKEAITYAEAKAKIEEASKAFFAVFEERGIVVEVGQPDGVGEPFTAERVKEIREGIDTAGWVVLMSKYEIVDDEGPMTFPSMESYYEEGLV